MGLSFTLGAKSTVFYLFERRVIRTELKVMTSLIYDVTDV